MLKNRRTYGEYFLICTKYFSFSSSHKNTKTYFILQLVTCCYVTEYVVEETGYVNVDKLSFFPLTQWVFKIIPSTFISKIAGQGENFDLCFFTPGRGDTVISYANVQVAGKYITISDQQIINFLTGDFFSCHLQ